MATLLIFSYTLVNEKFDNFALSLRYTGHYRPEDAHSAVLAKSDETEFCQCGH